MPRLLLIDDDRFLVRAMEKLFSSAGFCCKSSGSAGEARRALSEAEPDCSFDLLVLDVALPDQDGISFCRQLRQRSRVPVLLLSARSTVTDRVIGLEVGADDYLTKPFEPPELVARVRALLRRAGEYQENPDGSRQLPLGPVTLDLNARDVSRSGRMVGLTEREFELLHLMARHSGKALASEWLFENVWGFDAEFGLKTLTVCIGRIRKKIEADPDNPRLLRTLRGFGYRLVTDPDS